MVGPPVLGPTLGATFSSLTALFPPSSFEELHYSDSDYPVSIHSPNMSAWESYSGESDSDDCAPVLPSIFPKHTPLLSSPSPLVPSVLPPTSAASSSLSSPDAPSPELSPLTALSLLAEVPSSLDKPPSAAPATKSLLEFLLAHELEFTEKLPYPTYLRCSIAHDDLPLGNYMLGRRALVLVVSSTQREDILVFAKLPKPKPKFSFQPFSVWFSLI